MSISTLPAYTPGSTWRSMRSWHEGQESGLTEGISKW